ncbi:MAG: hypothetical protein FWB85_02705 [Chitinispirillia bacterium]|nr:hypothetical protein [Chitinispirillia bacterium]
MCEMCCISFWHLNAPMGDSHDCVNAWFHAEKAEFVVCGHDEEHRFNINFCPYCGRKLI